MTSRSVDRPAILVTALIALVLLAASTPFTVLWWGEGTTKYEVAWEELAIGEKDATTTGPSQTAEVPVNDKLVSSVTVLGPTGAPDCVDTPGAGRAPTTMTWVLSVRYANGTTTEIDRGTYQCGGPAVEKTYPRFAKPDIATREVESDPDESLEISAARAAVWDADLLGGVNETSVYVLTVSAAFGASQLPPSPLPLPVNQPTVSAKMTLRVDQWQDLLTEETDQEVVR